MHLLRLSPAKLLSRRHRPDRPPNADGNPGDFARELAGGFRSLRFSPAIEAAFQADTARSRWLNLLVCQIIGTVSLWIGILNERQTLPDVAETAIHMWMAVSALCIGVSLFCALMGPRRMAHAWLMDHMSTINGLAIGLGIVYATSESRAFSATVHAANLVLVVMWGGILCRLRFRNGLLIAATMFLSYALYAHAHTALQQVVIFSNIKVLAFTVGYSLLVNYAVEYAERRSFLLRKVGEQQQESLTRASARLKELSNKDPLTGLDNRRRFDEVFDAACEAALRNGEPVALLMVDVDQFKRYNDTYGHPAGDACLHTVAQAAHAVAQRHGGSAARLGGEEFAVILPGKNLDAAFQVGQAICAAVRSARIEHASSEVADHVTTSVGAASFAQHGDVAPEHGSRQPKNVPSLRQALLLCADAALYEAKQTGRNRVCAGHMDHGAWPSVPATPMPADAAPCCPPAPAGTASAACNNAGAMASNELADVPDPAAQEASLTETISKGFYGLVFPRALEADYQRAQAEQRRKHLIISAIVGVVLFNGYCFTNHSMYPDVADWFLGPQLAASIFMLLMTGLIASPLGSRTTSPMREAAYAISVCVLILVSLQVFAKSRELVAYGGYIAVFLIPMFAGSAARLPFRYTCLPAMVSLIGFVATAHGNTPIEKVVVFDVTTMMLNATFFVLVASYTLERSRRMDYLLERLGQCRREALAHTTEALRRLSMQDPLTGLHNRRSLEHAFEAWHKQQQALPTGAREAVSLLILDVDHFKRYNDGYGHHAGDGCLQRLACILQDLATQTGAFAARLGGEEFGMLLPGADVAQARIVGERLCEAVRGAHIVHAFASTANHVTVSVGAASSSLHEAGDHFGGHAAHNAAAMLTHLLVQADAALYNAKAAGRNRFGDDSAAMKRTMTAAS